MPFIVAGHPFPGSLATLCRSLEAAGADAIEVGIPFSDPIADGPVIAAAMHRSLTGGTTVQGILEEVSVMRGEIGIPLLAMVTISIVDRLGGPEFLDRLSASGFDGVIIPDADVAEIAPLAERADRLDLAFTSLVAPDTSHERVERIAAHAREFMYILARGGITGARRDAPELEGRIAELAEITSLPLVAGFGISTPAHVAAVLEHAQGAIVGSALVSALDGVDSPGELAEAVEDFVRPMAPGSGPTRAQA